MIPQLAEPYDKLEQLKGRFLEILADCSPEQLAFRTQPDAWTVLQVGHHVTIAEQRTAESIRRHRGMRSRRRSFRYLFGNACVWLVLKTGIRVKNPVPEAEPDADIDLPTLLEMWDRTRDELRSVLDGVKERGLEYAAFQHPVGGPYSVQEATHFLVAHLQHHLRQLERIRHHPSFPEGLQEADDSSI